ncbi:DUF885 domain-containing protein [Asaia sp. BMEF1]|uniref:DUF885 domain-containing protein n=1 Tax=Asaia sp. BMEF1 TaxID=3155932 RepID=UPI003F67008A
MKSPRLSRLALLGFGCLLGATTALASPAWAAAPDSKAATAFDKLLDDEWQYQLKNAPELATSIGDYRYNDRWSDLSLAHIKGSVPVLTGYLKRFEAIAPSSLDDQRQISRAMIIQQLQDTLEGIRLKTYEMPIDQMNGAQLQYPGFVSSIPFDTTKHYEDYLARLRAIPTAIDQVIALARLGEKDGLMQPRFLLEKAEQQVEQIAAPEGEKSPFGEPVTKFPASVPAADQARLRKAIVAAIDHDVRPAYERLAAFMKQGYAAYGRAQEGVWALPGGDALYRYDIRTLTTTTMTPKEIHQLGLDQVARIEGEMVEIAHKLGFADLAALRASVAKDPKLYATSREQIIDLYRKDIAQMEPALTRDFDKIPTTKLEVRPVERYREAEAAGAEYHQGTPDGSRPGIVFVNTGDYAKRDLYTIEDTAYHEGVPGHHFQISTAQSLPLPPFRQQGFYNAYIEGWALYAEGLGKELGFYKDLYSDYGRLNGELLRADRLVLDTGVHDLHWTRAQMLEFFHAHSPTSEPDMQAETDRYIAWPGQALGYMLGQQTILRLREKAKTELGSKFDIRKFHDVVLSGGALPLNLLADRVDAWIKEVKAQK